MTNSQNRERKPGCHHIPVSNPQSSESKFRKPDEHKKYPVFNEWYQKHARETKTSFNLAIGLIVTETSMSNEIEPVHTSEPYIMAKTAKKSNEQITSLGEPVPVKANNLPINLEYRKKSEKSFPLNELPHSDRYKNERIRQAQWSFNFLNFLFGLAALTSLISIPLYLTGNVPAAATAGVPLTGVIAVGHKLYKDANDRLDKT